MATYLELLPVYENEEQVEGFYQIHILNPKLFYGNDLKLSALCKDLGFSTHQYQRKREEILDYLTQYFDFECTPAQRGVTPKISISQSYTDYFETWEHQKQAEKCLKKAERAEDYWQFAKQDLIKTPRNSLARICRLAENDPVLRSKYQISATTIENAVRPLFKARTEKFDPQWVYKRNWYDETYYEVPDEYIPKIKECLQQKNLLWQEVLTAIGETDLGYLDKQQRDAKIIKSVNKRYYYALKDFKNQYGFFPFLAYQYHIIED